MATILLEAERISGALPDAELLGIDELGFYELVEEGMPPDEGETLTRYAYDL